MRTFNFSSFFFFGLLDIIISPVTAAHHWDGQTAAKEANLSLDVHLLACIFHMQEQSLHYCYVTAV